MAVHFIADLHLTDDDDLNAGRFANYLRGVARELDALYILGDLFDAWIGDDGSLGRHQQTLTRLAELATTGVPTYFMRGNRDFAVGARFFAHSRLVEIDDPCAVDLYGERCVLTHGDSLCTRDVAQQRFRAKYTDPVWRRRMARLPLFVRRAAGVYGRRRRPRRATRNNPGRMDIDSASARALMARHSASRLIHGHTHRPADHLITQATSDAPAERRHVVADWRTEQAEAFVMTTDGVFRHSLLDCDAHALPSRAVL